MNLLLVSCSFEDGARAKEIQKDSHYPIGLASLHAYIEGEGHHVKTLFLNDYPYDECLSRVKSESDWADWVGFQVLSHNRVCTYRAIDALPEKNIVLGGIHASVMYDQLLKKYPNVVVVIGEGEITLAELLRGGRDLCDIDGIAFSINGNVVKTPDRALIADLDSLPFPAHEVFWTPDRTAASIMTSRGCPFRCSFCSLDVVSRRKVRYRSVESVISELKHLKNALPRIKGAWIHDDSFFLDNARAISICRRVREENLGFRFIASGRFKPFSEELVREMQHAGFIHLMFGLESGCQRVLDRNHKGLKLLDATKAFQYLSESPIKCTAFLIVGLPGEDEDSIADTADFVNHLQCIKYTHYEDIGVATVYPGTELYDLMKKAGKIDDDYWLTDGPVPYYTAEHDLTTLNEFKERLLDRIAFRRIAGLSE